MDYFNEIDAGVDAVAEASILCRKIQRSLNRFPSLKKEDLSPVTVADFASQALIISRIRKRFPTDVILGEENSILLRTNTEYSKEILFFLHDHMKKISVNDLWEIVDQGKSDLASTDRFWVIDPVDGTKGFLRGDQFAVALSLIEAGEVRLGILGCPNLSDDTLGPSFRKGCILYAVKGGGTTIKFSEGQSTSPVFRSRNIQANAARMCESVEAGHSNHELHEKVLKALGIKNRSLRIDSQVKYAVLALEKADIYLRVPRRNDYREKIWDHAAGAVILTESGGKVTDLTGRILDFSKGKTLEANYGIAASAGGIHDQVLTAVAHSIPLS
ncbi:MAG: 3'(2'),5'-bisphosphate nucleotidase [Thermodesulfobacteriota bacterium]